MASRTTYLTILATIALFLATANAYPVQEPSNICASRPGGCPPPIITREDVEPQGVCDRRPAGCPPRLEI
ncbi:hypothetical protein BGZ68_008368 [Mortierella alpina]|nr:hypothetical protein BGZ68_008368 [Mortierella alpina]